MTPERLGPAAEMDEPRVRSDVAQIAAERAISRLRLGVMISGTLVFPLVDDALPTMRSLAYGLLAVGWLYTLAVLVFEPYRRWPVLATAWLTTPSDIVMTLLWVGATGGVESPWVVAIFVTLVVVSLRHRPRDTLFMATFAAAAYVAMAALRGQLGSNAATVAVHVGYIVLTTAACAVIARERLGRLAAHVALLDLTQSVAQVASWEFSIADGNAIWSREYRRIFGIPDDEEPSVESFYAAVHPDDLEGLKRAVADALPERRPFRFEHRIVTRRGEVRWVQCRGRVLLDDQGKPRTVVGSTQDITETKKLQEELLVGKKLASLGTLASGIAHEINNPLAYVATNLEVGRRALDSASVAPEAREELANALDAAQDGCRRVAAIVRSLKTFSRSDEDQRPVQLHEIADAAVAIAAHEIGHRARLTREYHPSPAALGNESRLLQVMLNLLVNAAQSIEPGDRDAHEIRVCIDAPSEGRVRLTVSDTGCGIREEHLPRLFDPFFTTKPPGVGTGLGLSICHGIIRDLGGEITVETKLGRGSTFTVVLPAAPAPAEESFAAPPELRSDVDGAVGPPPRARVLVVDDEARYAQSLRLLLGHAHDVTVASDGSRALELLSSGDRIDVVLCDLMMPGMDGIDLYEAMERAHPQLTSRIVFLTGGATTERARRFLAHAGVRHLEKPVEPEALERVIRDVTRTAPAASES